MSPVFSYGPAARGVDAGRVAVLILAGGSGTRLWPLSTRARPKQFARLIDARRSMLRLTWDRVPASVPRERIFVNVARGHEALALQQLPGLVPGNLIVAPEERNTLPIAGFATAFIEQRLPGATVLMLASDSRVAGQAAFDAALHDCALAAQAGAHLVALGVPASSPSIHYGYMTRGEKAPFGTDAWFGAGYLEKPALAVAERLLSEGRHDWNTGVFAWDAEVFFEACRRHAPAHHRIFEQMRGRLATMPPATLAALFAQLPALDLDRGLMEPLPAERAEGAPCLVLVRGRFEWDDIGSFRSLGQHLAADAAGNAVLGAVQASATQDALLVCDETHTLHVEGCSALLVAVGEEGDVVVCPRGRAGEVQALLRQPLFCGLGEAPDGRAVASCRCAGNRVDAFATLAECERVEIRSDSGGVVALLGLHDCRISVQGRQVEVRGQGQGKIAAAEARPAQAAPHWLTLDTDHDAMSERAALCLLQDLRELLELREHPVVVMSAGQTPEQLYGILRQRYHGALRWARLRFFQMDEYVPRTTADRGLFGRAMRRLLVDPLGLQGHFLEGDEGPQALADYEGRIEAAGGIDLVLHGIGANGHLGFNEPGSAFDAGARRVPLA
ncbi:MAG TPA: sugar phosphate nucleotidyltransferase, partial [Ideonella sp.]|nr:sugar phosphate nucleotidyltransferase [Ideonella sp.]